MKLKSFSFALFVFAILFSNAQQWGYATLIAPQNSTTVTLLDTNSTVIKTWSGLSGQTGYSCYLMPGGYLWRSVKTTNNSFMGGGLCGRVQKVDWNGTILFDYTISNANEITHHDICPMPNGDVMLIVYEKKTGTQMQAAGATSNSSRQLEKIVQLHPTGTNTATIAWQWNLYDHLCQNTNSGGANYVTSIVNNPQLFNVNYQVTNDWWHMNGIDYNETLDQVIVSSHNMNEHYIIDHSTTTAEAATHSGGTHNKGGDFLYRWGKPATYGASGSTNFNITHDAHWVPADCPKAGWLVGFNNKGVSNSQSSIDMWQPTWNGTTYTITPGTAYLPTTYGYRHNCQNQGGGGAGYTSNMGNSQQLPNGNMLVCLATAGDVYEVDSNNNQLWFYSTTGSIAQAFRYSRCFIENPSASITNISPLVCENSSTPLVLTTLVTATNAGNYTYNWSPATGLSSTTAANPSVTNISSPTTYTVTVSTGNCTATASVQVGINPSPNADAGNDQTSPVPGTSTQLTATGGTSYVWSTGDNTATITVSPTITTTYAVTVTNAAGCTATDDVVVTVAGGPLTVNVTATQDTFCASGTTIISAIASGGSGTYTYSWSSSETSENVTVSPTITTLYTVTVNDGINTATASVNIVVYGLPPVDAGNDQTISIGNSATITATGAGTYVWSNGATTASQTVSPTNTTIYTVTGTDLSGCAASAQVTVNVTGGALSVVISATDSTICEGESSQLFATMSGGSGTYSYLWSSSPAGFSSSLYNPFINPTSTTVYTVTVSDGNATVTGSLTINVLTLPAQPSITPSDTLLVSSSATNNVWYYYGNPTGDVTQTIDPTLNGSYQVQVIGANGCASPLSDPYEYIHVEIRNIVDELAVTMFPNPANDVVQFSGSALSKNFSVAVFDVTGRNVGILKNETAFSVADLSDGVYWVTIETTNGKTVKRLIVSK